MIAAPPIPFEIHITTNNFNSNCQADFIEFCRIKGAKPLIIELAKGYFIKQPMLTKVIYANNLNAVLSTANEISSSMHRFNFSVKRLKIEIPSKNYAALNNYPSDFDKYFEWHCKVNYDNPSLLLVICEKHKAHLSLNALKNQGNTRFITLREFGTKSKFEERVAAILNELHDNTWTVLKQQFEYCIYDNNKFLDNGWLPL